MLLFLFGLLLFLFSGLLLALLETTERREEDALLDSLKDDVSIMYMWNEIMDMNFVYFLNQHSKKILRVSQHTAIQTKKTLIEIQSSIRNALIHNKLINISISYFCFMYSTVCTEKNK